jgi:hypothetical protein
MKCAVLLVDGDWIVRVRGVTADLGEPGIGIRERLVVHERRCLVGEVDAVFTKMSLLVISL